MGLSQFEEVFPVALGSTLLDSDGTGTINIMLDDNRPSRIDHVWVSQNDSVDHSLVLGYSLGGSNYQFANVTIPASAGFLGVPAVDAIALIADPPIDGLIFKAGDHLTAAVEVAMGAGLAMIFVITGGQL